MAEPFKAFFSPALVRRLAADIEPAWPLKRVTLEAKDSASIGRKVSFAHLTARRHYPGRRRTEVLVNGVAFPLGGFEARP